MPAYRLSKGGTRSIWLASYPRSGNTLLRLLLRHVFGLRTASVYAGEIRTWEGARGLADLVGHYEKADLSAADLEATAAGRDTETNPPEAFQIVKTHEAPLDSGPAIFIVRDGRSSIVSYFHYLRDINSSTVALEDVLMGRQWPGSWSDHFRCWDPIRRPDTLLIRYEDLKGSTVNTCEKIGDFLQIPQVGAFGLSFSELHSLHPKFFRGGDDARNIAEMRLHQELFDSVHGDVMRELGYY